MQNQKHHHGDGVRTKPPMIVMVPNPVWGKDTIR